MVLECFPCRFALGLPHLSIWVSKVEDCTIKVRCQAQGKQTLHGSFSSLLQDALVCEIGVLVLHLSDCNCYNQSYREEGECPTPVVCAGGGTSCSGHHAHFNSSPRLCWLSSFCWPSSSSHML